MTAALLRRRLIWERVNTLTIINLILIVKFYRITALTEKSVPENLY